MEKLEKQLVLRDSIYGYVRVDYKVIKEIIDTNVFQRLRRIKQLSGVSVVFHCAEHSRFGHSLGVYELANRFLAFPKIKNYIQTEREQLLFLISALLHDIGHGAYSHAFEDVFLVNHEHIGAKIITDNKEIRNILDKIDNSFANDVSSIIMKKSKFKVIEQLISSQIDVDRLDYLERDAYFTGTAYGHVDLDRLLQVTRIVDDKVVFKTSGIHAIENYLISRYHMYWQVYYHPTARSYEVILEQIYKRVYDLLELNYNFKENIEPLRKIMKNKNDLDAYFEIDDYYINGLIAAFTKNNDKYLCTLANDFLNRHIWEYMDDTEENKKAISKIKKDYTEEEQNYYCASRTVAQSTYKDGGKALGEAIKVIDENGVIKTLPQKSKIIESLIESGVKSDPKFFYRKK